MAININKAVDKEFESKSLRELLDAPVAALEGISEAKGKLLGELGIKTIRDLAEWKHARVAQAIVELAKLEQ